MRAPTLGGTRVLVTAGGTREPIDAVRFLGNRSSGRMGYAIADAAAARGAQVAVVAANVALARNSRVRYIDVATAEQLAAACELEFATTDVLLMCAAVADFTPIAPAPGKIARDGRLTLELEPTPDVLAGLAARRRDGQTIVGFAAEHGDGALARARDKLSRKSLDAIVCNDVSAPDVGFDSERNEVTILTAAGEQHVAAAPKREIAEAVLDAVEALRR